MIFAVPTIDSQYLKQCSSFSLLRPLFLRCLWEECTKALQLGKHGLKKNERIRHLTTWVTEHEKWWKPKPSHHNGLNISCTCLLMVGGGVDKDKHQVILKELLDFLDELRNGKLKITAVGNSDNEKWDVERSRMAMMVKLLFG